MSFILFLEIGIAKPGLFSGIILIFKNSTGNFHEICFQLNIWASYGKSACIAFLGKILAPTLNLTKNVQGKCSEE